MVFVHRSVTWGSKFRIHLTHEQSLIFIRKQPKRHNEISQKSMFKLNISLPQVKLETVEKLCWLHGVHYKKKEQKCVNSSNLKLLNFVHITVIQNLARKILA